MKKFLIVFLLIAGFFGIKYFYMQPAFTEKDLAPDFSAVLYDGQEFQFSDLKGHIILLDFWGSWCGPCIQEMPALKALYQKYDGREFGEAKGFTIVSVAVEKDEERWKRAVERFAMPWRHQIFDPASSLRFFDSPIADQYGVKQLPTKFLIDEDGNIAGVDLTPAQIDEYLQKQL